MAIDFEIPQDAKDVRARVRRSCRTNACRPRRNFPRGPYKEVLGELREKARDQGLWCPFIPKEHGGMGLGPLANALVQMELGQSHLGALALNSQGPDDATILTLLAHGTELQKEKYPQAAHQRRKARLLFDDGEGRRRRCHGHADPSRKGRQRALHPERREVVFERGQRRRLALVMAKTDPDAPRHKQFSTFIVELPNPGYNIKRNIKTMAMEGPLSQVLGGGHAEIEIKDLRVPAENILGGEGNGFNMGQHRLAYGRLRHGMHNIAMAQRALDLAAKHVTNRATFGKKLSERQGVQWMLADCASELYMARLMLLHIAYKAEKGLDLRQENSIAKVFLAHMVHKVVDTAIQLHGALGYSADTPLAAWYTHIRSQRLVDGPDEVHRWTVGRNVIKAYEKFGTTASAAGGDLL